MHMVLKYHASDYKPVPNEEAVAAALRGIEPGEHMIPWGGGMEAMKDPAFIEKMKRGPIAFITTKKPGPPTMGPALLQWFIFCAVVSLFAAYVASRALGPGVEYMQVFRFAGTVAFVGYAVGNWQQTIWYGRPLSIQLKHTFDGLVFALLTAGVFGWLWPR
jgi:hypothetical protein